MARYCQLGRLLPAMEDIDTDHDAQLAEVKTVCSDVPTRTLDLRSASRDNKRLLGDSGGP